MKNLISVTPREFKRDFNEVMKMCTDMCMTANQEIIITIPSRKSNTYAEIAKLVPVENGRGIRYEYNKELMDKYDINASTNPKLSKIGAIMADAFEKEGVYSLISPEVEHRLARAVETAAKELVKIA